MRRQAVVLIVILTCLLSAPAFDQAVRATPQQPASPQSPEQFLGFRVGTDTKLATWSQIVEYMRLSSASSPRVQVREVGKTTNGNPFIAVEISAPDTIKDLARFKGLERKLYFQGGAPTDAERDEIFRSGKAVVLVTCSIHSSEIGASQMAIELVHKLATDTSPAVQKILDNVILVLVPSLNPDGHILVTDWYTRNLGTEFETGSMPWLYHPYVGHDNNRDAYMFTQKESQLIANLLWHDWFPAVWLDEHQMGNNGARIFVMPATDPINPNVHPLIYRWNGILGQSQAAALEAAGKDGIIYNATYTNFWQGAMAWAGWWHNQVGLLTEVASARLASPVEQSRAQLGRPAPAAVQTGPRQPTDPAGPLPAPRDVMPRTEYPRPWLGGRWSLRDIVDYELVATMGLLDAAASMRETLVRQIYEVNRATVAGGGKGDPAVILVPVEGQFDRRAAARLVDRLQIAGVEVSRAQAAFEADGKSYPAGTFIIPMTQVFARYAKDMLEKQTYPEVRRTPTSAPEPPYDVTAWSLGMLVGADVVFVTKPLPATVPLEKLTGMPTTPGGVTGTGRRFVFDYRGPDTAIVVNRLLKDGARIAFDAPAASGPARVSVTNVARTRVEAFASEFGLQVQAVDASRPGGSAAGSMPIRAPRVALYQPWTASMDEGWTRWVLEQYEFAPTTIHNADVQAGHLKQKFDVIVMADQSALSIVNGSESRSARPEYRGGIGSEGVKALQTFVSEGGTLALLGNATELAIERFSVPVRNDKRGLTRDQHFAPGTIVNVEVDTRNPLGYGLPAQSYGFYNNSPFFALLEGFSGQHLSVIARYPNTNVVGSGWLKGEELMAGRAAVVAVDTEPGRIVLFGLRPQHRAQTQATFPLLFNALYGAATTPLKAGS